MKRSSTSFFTVVICILLLGSLECSLADTQITAGIHRRLSIMKLGRHEITIEDYNGRVTLSGFVASEDDRLRVVQIAQTEQGVREVVDHLRIGATAPSAVLPGSVAVTGSVSNLAESIRESLARDPHLGRYRITIEELGGAVTIRGTADTQAAMTRIRDIAAATRGVTSVNMLVDFPQEPTNVELEQRIRAVLARDAGISTDGVTIECANGVATFKGRLPNQRAIDAMLSSAVMVDGVKNVRSELTVGQQ